MCVRHENVVSENSLNHAHPKPEPSERRAVGKPHPPALHSYSYCPLPCPSAVDATTPPLVAVHSPKPCLNNPHRSVLDAPFMARYHFMAPPSLSRGVAQRLYTVSVVVALSLVLFVSMSFFISSSPFLSASLLPPRPPPAPASAPASAPSSSSLSFWPFQLPHHFIFYKSSNSDSHNHLHHRRNHPPYANSALTDLSRIRYVLRRLSFHNGPKRRRARFVHMTVSLIGIFGMFAAVIGALLTPWLAEAGNSVLDDDTFAFWVNADDDDDDDDDVHRACGPYRENKFALLRTIDVA